MHHSGTCLALVRVGPHSTYFLLAVLKQLSKYKYVFSEALPVQSLANPLHWTT